MKSFAFMSLNFNCNIKFHYIKKHVYPAKFLGEVVRGCRKVLGWIELWVSIFLLINCFAYHLSLLCISIIICAFLYHLKYLKEIEQTTSLWFSAGWLVKYFFWSQCQCVCECYPALTPVLWRKCEQKCSLIWSPTTSSSNISVFNMQWIMNKYVKIFFSCFAAWQ